MDKQLEFRNLYRCAQALKAKHTAVRQANPALLPATMGGGFAASPYKATIARWLWPDVFKNQDTSVAMAKKVMADYKKAQGPTEGLAELMVFYCEQASGFSRDVGLQDESYLDALVRMFGQALKAIATLPETQRSALWARLDAVRRASHDIGYSVGDDMDNLLAEHGADD